MCAAGECGQGGCFVLLNRYGPSGLSVPALPGPQLPSRLQDGPDWRVNRLNSTTAIPKTAMAMAAFSEYKESPATAADPMARPIKGTAQQATHATPVIQAVRLMKEVLGLDAFGIKAPLR